MTGQVFRYESFATDSGHGLLTCTYSLDGREFSERVRLSPGPAWDTPAAQAAARLVFLLAGVSYYKTAAPTVIDLGDTPLTVRERDFLRDFYLNGLAEFAYRNGLDLTGLHLRTNHEMSGEPHPASIPSSNPEMSDLLSMGGGRDGAGVSVAEMGDGRDGAGVSVAEAGGGRGEGDAVGGVGGLRALVPFGGGIDSIVTVEAMRRRADVALFVVSRPGDTYDAIEQPAAVSGLPVRRAEREIDPQLLRSAENGFLNGHVPVTGIISAIAILAAVLDDRDAVVMSNEWSASIPTLEFEGKPVNHQYSKSASFEAAFRDVLSETGQNMPEYFSWLRDRTELWVGREVASLERYHRTFRSCNKAFYADRHRRLDHWCGECDKCCFIDLILAPFLPETALRQIFAVAGEPLGKPELKAKFRALLGAGAKPFECVGEVTECRAAALLAAERPDRVGNPLLQELATEVSTWPDAPTPADIERMLHPVGGNFVPAPYL